VKMHVVIWVCLATAVVSVPRESAAGPQVGEPPETVGRAYPRLTSGVLAPALLEELPHGVLLRVGEIEVGADELEELLANAPESLREQLEQNAFFVLEDLAARKLLLLAARRAAAEHGEELAGGEERQTVEDYLKALADEVSVTEAEVAEFYRENQDMFGGATLGQVKDELTQYLLEDRRQEVVARRPLELARTTPMAISASWVEEQVPLATDNAVDRARSSGKPSVVDFGAEGCRPCEMMAKVLKALRKNYGERVNVVFVHVREEPVLATRFGIRSIPAQVFFDAGGREVLRHVGFMPQEAIEEKLRAMGVE